MRVPPGSAAARLAHGAKAKARRALSSTVGTLTDQPVLALTFDDGPDERLTGAVLDVLRRRQVPATFFVVARAAQASPTLLRRMVDEGHEVALHGDVHVDLRRLPRPAQVRAVLAGRRRLARVSGSPPRWFRPPYGKQTPVVVAACRAAGMQAVLWTTSAYDWKALPLADQLDHVRPGLTPGAIVLLHDGAAGAGDPPPPGATQQAALLDGLLDEVARRGLEPVTVGELLRRGRPVREPWFGSWLHH